MYSHTNLLLVYCNNKYTNLRNKVVSVIDFLCLFYSAMNMLYTIMYWKLYYTLQQVGRYILQKIINDIIVDLDHLILPEK